MSVWLPALALVFGVVVPWLFVAALVPSLESSEAALVTNYRGRRVFYGLGIVWLVWAGCAILAGVGAAAVANDSAFGLLTLAGPLALVAFSLGVVDDAYGSSAARGFKGHIKAMLSGRLTTGGIKLFGVSLASLIVAAIVGQFAYAELLESQTGAAGFAMRAGLALAGGAAIALTSNFVNLTDLRPGRALKAYSVLAVAGALSAGLLLPLGMPSLASDAASRALDVLALLLMVLGPVFAVWRFDLGERGMLGDAGANPMGAVAGLLVVAGLPVWGLLVYLALMLALNLASERVSFSKVIDASPFLSRIDAVGRRSEAGQESVQSRPPSAGDHV